MLYSCYNCNIYCFEEMCPRCGEAHMDLYIPLDPKYFPEFKYVTQALC